LNYGPVDGGAFNAVVFLANTRAMIAERLWGGEEGNA